MPSPKHDDVNRVVFERLQGSTKLKALVDDRIYNHVPQDEVLPNVRFRWEQAHEFDTKDSAGYDGFIVFDVWTDYRGDTEAAQIQDVLDELFHDVSLDGLSVGQNLLVRHDSFDSFTEPDGLTHHQVARFRAIMTT